MSVSLFKLLLVMCLLVHDTNHLVRDVELKIFFIDVPFLHELLIHTCLKYTLVYYQNTARGPFELDDGAPCLT